MNTEPKQTLDEYEELQLLQLLQLQHWSDRRRSELTPITDQPTSDPPAEWSSLSTIHLYDWQRQALECWSAAGHRGIIKVVTGAGKTMLALAAIDRMFRLDPELRVAIVVPTIVLLDQWKDELRTRLKLPPQAVGSLGGGSDDQFDQSRRILV